MLWGTSYSGGHVVAVAAEDPRIAGVIAQNAAMDGPLAVLEILRYAGQTFRNELRARGVLPILVNRPVARAARLRMPLFLAIASRDNVAPPSAVEKVARRVKGPVQVQRYDVGHFDLYRGEPFEKCVTAQVEFLSDVAGARMDA